MTLIPGMTEHGIQMQGSGGPSGSSGPVTSRDTSSAIPPPSSVLPGYFTPTAASHSDVINIYPGSDTTAPSSLSTPSSGPLYVPTTHAMMTSYPPPAAQRTSGVGASPWPMTSECGSGYSSYTSGVPSQSYPTPLTSWHRTDGATISAGDPLYRSNGLSPFSPYMSNELGSWGNYNYTQGLSLAGQGLQYSRTLGKSYLYYLILTKIMKMEVRNDTIFTNDEMIVHLQMMNWYYLCKWWNDTIFTNDEMIVCLQMMKW